VFTLCVSIIAFVLGAFIESEFALTRHFEAWLYKVFNR